jgi:hypothetical protein
MRARAKLASLLCRRHIAVLPSPANVPVPSAMISAMAATGGQRVRRSRHDHRSRKRHRGDPIGSPPQLADRRPSGARAPSCTIRPLLSSTTRSAAREIS